MKLSELTTTYEKRRAIEYGADGNSVVRHWRIVRHVAGSVCMTEPEVDNWGDKYFSLYLFFRDVPDGVILARRLRGPEKYEVESLLAETENRRFTTPDGFIRATDAAMENGNFIGNAVIEFVRQWNPARAAVYASYRETYYEKKHEQERREQAEREAEAAATEAEEQRKRREEDAAARALYLGWADSMTPLGFGKMHKAMEALIRTDGVVETKRDFVIRHIRKGYAPEQRDGVTSWRKLRGEWVETKPRTEYRMNAAEDEDGAKVGYEVSKTEFAFAKYLTEHPERLKEADYGTS